MPVKFKRLLLASSILAFLILQGCQDNTKTQSPQNTVLVSYQSVISHTAGELKSFLAGTGTSLTSLLTNDVTVYTITYKTLYRGQEVKASGLVALPKSDAPVGMVSFQHGTIASHAEAPSMIPLGSTEFTLYAGLASAGFIAVVPDYIGFGSSSNVIHPYYVQEATATVIVDMLRAAKELATTLKTDFNGKLFLAGYSQGGYATMAAHKYIEQNGLTDFSLIASFPASGGYDVKGMQEYFFGLTTYSEPFYLAYVAVAYKSYYSNWTQGLSDFFNEPYASTIPGLLDGTKSSSEIDAGLTTSISALVKADLRTNIDSDPKYKYIVDAFRINSLTDWKPAVRMYMYHGDADITVPYNNSVVTLQKLIANGTPTSIVTLTALPGANHSTGVLPYLQSFIPIMVSLK